MHPPQPRPAEPAPAGAPDVRTAAGRFWERRERLLRACAVLALAWAGGYLAWRVGWSGSGAHPLAWALLLVCEAYGAWSLAVLTWLSWRRPAAVRPPATPGHRVDVYVCARDEPAAVLRATLTGCARLTYPHTTYLLDDARRPELAELAAELGAYYLTRPDAAHGRAGSVDHALTRTDGDLLLVLDADQVPLPDTLDALVGYFDDPAVAVAQSPHDFLDHDSVEHHAPGRHERSVLHAVLGPGRDRHGAATWLGAAALLRRAALLEAGGVAAGELRTTIRMQRRGWVTRHHGEVLVQGLAPQSLAAYLRQRGRWARRDLAVLRTPDSPLRAGGLTARQRAGHLAALGSHLAGPVRVLLLAVLAAALWTGALPMDPGWWELGLLWAPATLLGAAASAALCRGYLRVGEAFHAELTGAESQLRALLPRRAAALLPRRAAAPAGQPAPGRRGPGLLRQLRLPVLLAAALAGGLLARGLDAAGLLPAGLRPPQLGGAAAWAVPALAALELYRVTRTLVRHVRRRQLRRVFRFPVRTGVRIDGAGLSALGRITDLNPVGASVVLPRALPPGSTVRLRCALPDARGGEQRLDVRAAVLSCAPVTGSVTLGTYRAGLRFTDVPAESARALVEYCFVVAARDRLRGPVAPAPRRPAADAARTA